MKKLLRARNYTSSICSQNYSCIQVKDELQLVIWICLSARIPQFSGLNTFCHHQVFILMLHSQRKKEYEMHSATCSIENYIVRVTKRRLRRKRLEITRRVTQFSNSDLHLQIVGVCVCVSTPLRETSVVSKAKVKHVYLCIYLSLSLLAECDSSNLTKQLHFAGSWQLMNPLAVVPDKVRLQKPINGN